MRRNLAIKKDWIVPTALAFLLVISTACDAQDVKSDATSSSSSPSSSDLPLVIVDADLYHYADDHEAFVMIANLHQRGMIELLGLTLVTGNHWLSQIESDALKAVERLNLQSEIPVYRGARQPLLHNQNVFAQDKDLYGAIYAGAWSQEDRVTAPPDGLPTIRSQEQHAVDFIIETLRAHPGEVTIVALGPLTNLALAIRKEPEISENIKEIIYMGGNIRAPGNVTAAAEFNWWFDAEAAAIVLSEPVRHVVVPLDATDQILFTKAHYQEWIEERYPDHYMATQFFKPKFEQTFQSKPEFTIPVWDALVSAYLFDPSVVSESATYWLGVDPNRGPNYGGTLVYPHSQFNDGEQPPGTQKAEVILKMDENRFWAIYEDLVFNQGVDSPPN